MRRSLQCAIVAALAASISTTVVAAPTASSSSSSSSNTNPAPRHVLHEERGIAGRDWVKRDRIEGSAILPMRIGLTQANLHRGYDMLMEVSHPDSPKYGQWWSAEEVHDMFSPSDEAVDAVREWLTSSGIADSRIVRTDNKGWFAFDATAEEAESLLQTEFYEHESRHGVSKTRVGCDKYHVPEHVAHHIDYITPGIKLTPVVKRTRTVENKKSLPKPKHQVDIEIEVEKRTTRTRPVRKGKAPLDDIPFPFNIFPWGWKPDAAELLPEDVRDCGRNITPACYRALYGIPQPIFAVPGHSLGLYEQGDYFAKEDLDLFFAKYAPYVPQGTYPIPALIDGAMYGTSVNDTVLDSGESDIDIDISTSLIHPQTVTVYQVDDQIYEPQEVATTNLFNTFLDALDGSYCNYTAYGETGDDPNIDPVYPDPAPGGYKGQLQCGVYKPTNVISASYGQAEADLPANYTKRQCNEFMKLGLQGHSILFASGDYGVASFPGDGDANGCLGPDGTIFNPQYPDNCPYVTVVGATMLYPDQTVLDPESVMNVNLSGAPNFTSSGGFSNYFGRPSYQESAVDTYFAHYDPPYPYYSEFSPDFDTVSGIYNRIGRAYPDVSANGANLRAFTNALDEWWYGTSLASPLFASVLTLLNQERALIGKGPIGFVNPVLYAHPEVLNDITNGTSAGCGTLGFAAVPGWDPVTGLGTPNYAKMSALFLELP